jgi:hypothetical protein
MNRFPLAQERYQRRDLVKAYETSGSIKGWEFVDFQKD